jgi:threonine/homoserine/homoserine lactone efflux protein
MQGRLPPLHGRRVDDGPDQDATEIPYAKNHLSYTFMYKLLRIFCLGLFISLLGSLPLGSLNVAAFQIYFREGLLNAVYFSVGVALVEVLYVRISLVAMKWVMKNKKWFRMLEWFTIVLFLFLAVYTFVSNAKAAEDGATPAYLKSNLHRFLLGVFLCAINPVQIPFWFLWSTYLVSNKKLESRRDHYNFYCIGIGIGTLLGEAIYMYGGEWLVKSVGANQQQINYFVAGVFLVTALIQLYRVLAHKDKLDSKELADKVEQFEEAEKPKPRVAD